MYDTLTDAVNQALGLLGQPPIQNVEDPGTTLAKYLDSALDGAIRSVQNRYNWAELVVIVDVPPTDTQTSDGYYQFPIPHDCLHIVGLKNDQSYERRGRYFVCEANTATLIYHAYSREPSEWSEYLFESVYYELAARLAMPLTQNANLSTFMQAESKNRFNLNTARAEKATTSPLHRPISQDYLTSRYGRTTRMSSTRYTRR